MFGDDLALAEDHNAVGGLGDQFDVMGHQQHTDSLGLPLPQQPHQRLITPRRGCSSPTMHLSSVVLPAPLRPISATNSPELTLSETSDSVGAPLYANESRSTWSSGPAPAPERGCCGVRSCAGATCLANARPSLIVRQRFPT